MSRQHRGDERSEESLLKDEEITHLTAYKSLPHRRLRGNRKTPIPSIQMLMGREVNFSGIGRFSSADCCHILSRFLPLDGPWLVDRIKSRAYVSQFSPDGTLLVAGYQGSHIRVYDAERNWKMRKDILAKSLRWTITDTCLSPDQRFLAYSSMWPVVHIVNIDSSERQSIANVTEIHDGFDLSSGDEYDDFGIFSIKFSSDGRELVASASDQAIYVYDLVAHRSTLRIPAHMSDVNTVCFGDESGNILYSGSDDHLCKVWDRRCSVGHGDASGVLTGHVQGITCVSSRGDGRYFISNGKDQTTKLWDIRKMSSNTSHVPNTGDADWDYRWMQYPRHARKVRHPCDLSLATYRGHSVLQTLIRCYFSPEYSTGQKYIYTGSSDGCVYIYDMVTGNVVGRLEYHDSPVRDCTWHPYIPMMVSSSWDGYITRWEYGADSDVPCLPRQRQSHQRTHFPFFLS